MAEEKYNPSWEKAYGITEEQWSGASKEQVKQFHFYTTLGVFGNIQGQNSSDEETAREVQSNLGKIIFPKESSKVDLDRLFGVKK